MYFLHGLEAGTGSLARSAGLSSDGWQSRLQVRLPLQ